MNRDSKQVTTEDVYQEIDRHHVSEPHASIYGMYQYIGISRSGYYQRKQRNNNRSPRQLRKKFILGLIKTIWNKSNRIYGAGKITHVLNDKDAYNLKISELTVGKYMRELGISARYIKCHVQTTCDSDYNNKLVNILDEQFNPSQPNAVWCIDTTYIPVRNGFVYLTSIMDLFSRRIIGWDLSETLEVSNVTPLIERTKKQRHISKPMIIHSDRGSQITSEAYRKATSMMTRSYSKKAFPWDNACIESFHALIKREWLNQFNIYSYHEARRLVFEYIETFYNTVRIHSHCGFKSPKTFEEDYQLKHHKLQAA
ncbi:IS3 family transposase [Limosilactobacillus equigenerosi]|uniref:IS3 family transposase n=1 Tax=Limosilactobacillus equigenerosi TaxID=417373 RepID=UPI0022875A0F|nr:IS3 family transposase [Limosilactobacillus equigenerosi]